MKLVRRDPDKGYLDSWLWVPKRFTNVGGVKSALTFEFSDPYSEHRVKLLRLYQETDHHLLVPRRFWDVSQLPFPIVDCRPRDFKRSPVTHNIKLDHKQDRMPDGSKKIVPTGKTVQTKAAKAMLSSQGGILQLACGLGKTIVFLYLVAEMKVPALIIVDNTQLLKQWRNEIDTFLNVPGGVGIIQAEKFDWKKWVVLATYQTIAARADTLQEEVRRWFGVVGWDEGHHVAAPTYARGADLFYGLRFALTATPKRDDGHHVIYEYHIGEVLHKDLSQDLKPRVVFRWTDMQLDETRPEADVRDTTGELHLSKLGVYYGRWLERMDLILNDIKTFVNQDRKVLVLSNSIDEAMNFLALWTDGPGAKLYTDIPIPTPQEVGETLSPVHLTPKEKKKITKDLERINERLITLDKRLNSPTLTPPKQQQVKQNKTALEDKKRDLEQYLKQARVGSLIERELRKRQKAYREQLLNKQSTAGLMIYKVPPAERDRYIKTKQVVFAITKYGKEGLDAQDLDTILVSMPFSSRNGLQQLMGRPSRADNIKQEPLVVIYEDNIGPIIGMCQKLRNHLRSWPHEENGPYDYEFYNHPRKKEKWTTSMAFGQS